MREKWAFRGGREGGFDLIFFCFINAHVFFDAKLVSYINYGWKREGKGERGLISYMWKEWERKRDPDYFVLLNNAPPP